MSGKREVDRGDSLLITSKDRVDGFSIVTDGPGNITLLRWGKSVAWFSATVSEETLRAALELAKDRERSAKGAM